MLPVYLELSMKPKLNDPGAFFFKSTVKREAERVGLALSKNVSCFVGFTALRASMSALPIHRERVRG